MQTERVIYNKDGDPIAVVRTHVAFDSGPVLTGQKAIESILDMLSEGPQSAQVMADALGMEVSGLYRHLRALNEEGRIYKTGNVRTCRWHLKEDV
jgi:DNA-binding transcriptional ArsR family regulator